MKAFTSLFIAIIAFFTISSFIPTAQECEIYNSTVRLHVIANSDSESDQSLKLKVRDAMRLTLSRFSCKSAYLRCPLRRSFAVLSDFSLPTSFNHLFRQMAAVSLLGLYLACIASAGILTGSSSPTPLGFGLAPD